MSMVPWFGPYDWISLVPCFGPYEGLNANHIDDLIQGTADHCTVGAWLLITLYASSMHRLSSATLAATLAHIWHAPEATS